MLPKVKGYRPNHRVASFTIEGWECGAGPMIAFLRRCGYTEEIKVEEDEPDYLETAEGTLPLVR